MTLDEFWTLIEESKSQKDQCAYIKDRLVKMGEAEIISYAEHSDRILDEAYRWDLWGGGVHHWRWLFG